MTRGVVFRPQARQEFDSAADWYEREQPGLGGAFLAEVERLLHLIAGNPSSFPEVLNGVRKAVVRRFPYYIYFRIRAETIVVLAVFHSARNPTLWRARS
ncbi:MAG: type II toxin-antitoxin system RelE/ParE family toxin [Gammaproteobacteria bacterium]|nr:type II toxin-antitoxin system RelE/ParE family toxin [Gammaproteobacteria bacterium]MBU1407243.1 type II toxin-antitoxin system RelE/ParE family toxin [Gammaproteobacteria bacterium]MBU1531383.1 type II toxin-antitoxin system RelE/ParE family toxin [Gammaproteobacteria bacterium]